jgi:hypothetical protein
MPAPEFTYRVNATGITIPQPDTVTYFDRSYTETGESPIDKFFLNVNKLNLLIVNTDTLEPDLLKTQYKLILLGYISAVESYLREIIRRLIVTDKCSRAANESQMLSFGAASHYEKDLLPEALLENCSFANKKNVIDAFKTFLGLKGHTKPEAEDVLSEFEKICQLRHCIVHRFGKLGSNNAIKFGLAQHLSCLEKPIDLDTRKLYEVYQICENTVLVLNDYLFKRIITRTIEPDNSEWTWDFRRDKKKFKEYYELFVSLRKPPAPPPTLKDIYTNLRNYKNSL